MRESMVAVMDQNEGLSLASNALFSVPSKHVTAQMTGLLRESMER